MMRDKGVAFGMNVRFVHGTGSVIISGNLQKSSMEAVTVAVSWAHLNVDRICQWMDGSFAVMERDSEAETIIEPDRDVAIHFDSIGDLSKEGYSLGAATAAAVLGRALKALCHAELKKGVAITGEVNLRGDLLPVSDIQGKVVAAKELGCSMVVIPEANKSTITDLLECSTNNHLNDWIRHHVFTAKDMIDVLGYSVQGQYGQE